MPGQELGFDFDEVAEGDAAAEAARGDDQVGEAAGGGVFRGWVVRRAVGDVVDEVLVVGVGQLLRGAVVDFGEDEGGEGGGLGGGRGGVFREDGGAVGDAGAVREGVRWRVRDVNGLEGDVTRGEGWSCWRMPWWWLIWLRFIPINMIEEVILARSLLDRARITCSITLGMPMKRIREFRRVDCISGR